MVTHFFHTDWRRLRTCFFLVWKLLSEHMPPSQTLVGRSLANWGSNTRASVPKLSAGTLRLPPSRPHLQVLSWYVLASPLFSILITGLLLNSLVNWTRDLYRYRGIQEVPLSAALSWSLHLSTSAFWVLWDWPIILVEIFENKLYVHISTVLVNTLLFKCRLWPGPTLNIQVNSRAFREVRAILPPFRMVASSELRITTPSAAGETPSSGDEQYHFRLRMLQSAELSHLIANWLFVHKFVRLLQASTPMPEGPRGNSSSEESPSVSSPPLAPVGDSDARSIAQKRQFSSPTQVPSTSDAFEALSNSTPQAACAGSLRRERERHAPPHDDAHRTRDMATRSSPRPVSAWSTTTTTTTTHWCQPPPWLLRRREPSCTPGKPVPTLVVSVRLRLLAASEARQVLQWQWRLLPVGLAALRPRQPLRQRHEHRGAHPQ